MTHWKIMKKYLMMALALLGLATNSGCKAKNHPNVETVTPQIFEQRQTGDSTALLLDVRTPEEYAQGHLKGAMLLNWLDRSAFEEGAKSLPQGRTLYVYCRSGKRSAAAAGYLARQGFKVVDMEGGYLAWTEAGLPVTLYDTDTFTTGKGRRVAVTFIKHGTLMIDVDGYVIHIDPVKMFGTDYTRLPKADLLLVTHEHSDHYDPAAIREVCKDAMLFISNGRVAQLSRMSQPMQVGETRHIAEGGIVLTATPAYNTTPGREKYHPKGRDVGFLIDIDDLRIYVSGDTEDIPELADLKDVDVAFLSVNQPYTMTPRQCIHAIGMFRPAIVYPYHYGDTDLTPVTDAFRKRRDIEVRVRQMQ